MSVINHSCAPNCVSTFDGKSQIVRALVDIPAGVELTVGFVHRLSPWFCGLVVEPVCVQVAYTDTLAPRIARQLYVVSLDVNDFIVSIVSLCVLRSLQTSHFFHCRCPRCEVRWLLFPTICLFR